MINIQYLNHWLLEFIWDLVLVIWYFNFYPRFFLFK